MSIISDSSRDRVMIFIDLRNINNSSKTDSTYSRLDYIKMVKTFRESRILKRAYVFDGIDTIENSNPSNDFHNLLRYHGFTVDVIDSYDPITDRQKGVDVNLVCKVMRHAFNDDFDTAIIVSGDGDFVPLVEEIKQMGKKVEVAAFEGSCNRKMKLAADRFHCMDSLPLLEMESVPEEGIDSPIQSMATTEVF